MIYYANTKHNTASTDIVMSEKVGKKSSFARCKEVKIAVMKGAVYQEHRTILNVHAASNGFKCMRQNWQTKGKNRQINSDRNVNTSLLVLKRTNRQKFSKYAQDLNSTTNCLNLADIDRTSPQNYKGTFFSSSPEKYSLS